MDKNYNNHNRNHNSQLGLILGQKVKGQGHKMQQYNTEGDRMAGVRYVLYRMPTSCYCTSNFQVSRNHVSLLMS